MNYDKQHILARITYLQESIKSWSPWYCEKHNCMHRMCKVRTRTLDQQRSELRELQNYWGILVDRNRLRV